MNTETERKQMVFESTIIQGLVGSTVHGCNNNDATEDRDEMGVCIEPLSYLAGLDSFEQHIYRTAAEREGNHNARSRAGDLDLTVYSLKKYIRLALKGNPTILTLLFVPPDKLTHTSPEGRALQALAPKLVSKRAGRAFLGYMQAQHDRLLGIRGGKHGTRPDRINAFGYDSKYAMHVLRLGIQGKELLMTGKLTLPIAEPDRSFLLEVRNGKHPLASIMVSAALLMKDIETLLQTTKLPDDPDEKYVEAWMLKQYEHRIVGDYEAPWIWPNQRLYIKNHENKTT